MPKRPARFAPTHQRTTTERKRDHDRSRSSATWRAWYKTARWSSVREAQLSSEPLCVMCIADEIVTAANVCDHVVAHRGNEELFWSGPFQSLCEHHHNSTKQREERSRGKT